MLASIQSLQDLACQCMLRRPAASVTPSVTYLELAFFVIRFHNLRKQTFPLYYHLNETPNCPNIHYLV